MNRKEKVQAFFRIFNRLNFIANIIFYAIVVVSLLISLLGGCGCSTDIVPETPSYNDTTVPDGSHTNWIGNTENHGVENESRKAVNS